MAIINCPECNNEVSDKAETCPKCGFGLASKLASVELTETIYQNKSIECFKSIRPKIQQFKEQVESAKEGFTYYLILIPLLFAGFIPGIIWGFFKMLSKEKLKKLSVKLNECMNKVYFNVSQEDARKNFDIIESNVVFQTEANKSVLMSQIYVYAYDLNADAIAIGNMSANTEIDASTNRSGKVSIDSITTHSTEVSFLKSKDMSEESSVEDEKEKQKQSEESSVEDEKEKQKQSIIDEMKDKGYSFNDRLNLFTAYSSPASCKLLFENGQYTVSDPT